LPKVTIKDVAVYSGVSLGTVSRVLNGKADVQNEYVSRVNQAIEALGYKPLVKRNPTPEITAVTQKPKVKSVGFLFDRFDDQEQMQQDQFDIAMLRGISNCLFEKQMQLVYEPCRKLIDEDRLPQMLTSGSVDGILLKLEDATHVPWVKRIAKACPTVVLGVTNRDERYGVHSVLHDNYLSAYQAMAFLYDLGHQRIGYWAVTNNGWMPIYHIQRRQGFERAIEWLGLPFESDWLLEPEHDVFEQPFEEVARESLAQWLAMGSKRPTAVMCVSDSHALAMIQACRKLGLSVPEDMSIIGFMDMYDASRTAPQITSVAFPNPETGRQAIQILGEIKENPHADIKHISFGGRVIERKSHAKPYDSK
jgi:DNA-binding LacI/PurR family transcriptional regulator